MRWFTIFALFMVAFSNVACVNSLPLRNMTVNPTELMVGKTTRQQVLAHYGPAAQQAENGRIVFYRLISNKAASYNPETVVQYYSLSPPGKVFLRGTPQFGRQSPHDYSLVLIFDKNGILAQSNLVRIW